jgi:hypothetical protein
MDKRARIASKRGTFVIFTFIKGTPDSAGYVMSLANVVSIRTTFVISMSHRDAIVIRQPHQQRPLFGMMTKPVPVGHSKQGITVQPLGPCLHLILRLSIQNQPRVNLHKIQIKWQW